MDSSGGFEDVARRLTYRSRGRSLIEVVLVSLNVLPLRGTVVSTYPDPHSLFSLSTMVLQAVCFVIFLVGFITVLCIGNYFRAKRAQERQRQRRLAKLAASSNAAAAQGMYASDGNYSASYEAPAHIPIGGGVQA